MLFYRSMPASSTAWFNYMVKYQKKNVKNIFISILNQSIIIDTAGTLGLLSFATSKRQLLAFFVTTAASRRPSTNFQREKLRAFRIQSLAVSSK
jgi:arginine exporter protein ArgO